MYQNYLGTILAVYQLIPWSCSHIWFSTCPFVFCSCACWKRISILQYNPSRGAELFDATLSNEAMHQRGKGGLINHLYLLHIHGDETVLWLPSFCLWGSCCFEFAWNIHYHELGTERAISLIQVCILWWMSDKVPQGQGFDPEQPLPRGKHDWEKLNVEFTIFNLVIRLSIVSLFLLRGPAFW